MFSLSFCVWPNFPLFKDTSHIGFGDHSTPLWLNFHWLFYKDPHCCSVTKLCPTLCDPVDYSTAGLPVPLHLPEFTEVHVHWICDAIQSCLPLLPYSPMAFSLSQDQSLSQWVGSLYQVAEVLELQLQYQSFQWTIWCGTTYFEIQLHSEVLGIRSSVYESWEYTVQSPTVSHLQAWKLRLTIYDVCEAYKMSISCIQGTVLVHETTNVWSHHIFQHTDRVCNSNIIDTWQICARH